MLLYTLPTPCRDLLEDLPFLGLLHDIPEGACRWTSHSSGCCMASPGWGWLENLPLLGLLHGILGGPRVAHALI